MKFQQLTKEDPLEVIEVFRQFQRPIPRNDGSFGTIKMKQIQTFVFTDGEVFKEDCPITVNIDQYFFGKKEYPYPVDFLQKKNIYFQNHHFVITYLNAKEYCKIGNLSGWFSFNKNVSIYLENLKDKKALKEAKKIIQEIHEHDVQTDYSSYLNMLASQTNGLKSFKVDKVSENVYKIGAKPFHQ